MSINDRVGRLQTWRAMMTHINNRVNDEIFEPTDWETDFLESIQRRLDEGNELTERQEDTLTTIWEKA